MRTKRNRTLYVQCESKVIFFILFIAVWLISPLLSANTLSFENSTAKNKENSFLLWNYENSRMLSNTTFVPDPDPNWLLSKHRRLIPDPDPDWLLKKHQRFTPEPDPDWLLKKCQNFIFYPDPNWFLKKQTGTPGLYFGVKTNLLYWAGITPDLNLRPYIPNGELEWFAFSHFSLNFDGSYVYLHNINSDQEQWGISSIGIEPRYWLAKTDHFIGLFVGVYALTGQFDVKLNRLGQTGHTGNFNEGGISLGYYWPLSTHWGLEAGGRLGFRSVSGDIYRFVDPNHFYYRSSFSQNKIGLTGIRLSLCYRLWKNSNNKGR